MDILLFAAVLFLSFSNGSNDNFKGVATLRGSRIATYRTALLWGTAFTFMGSLASLWVSSGLIALFSGNGLVPHEVVRQGLFLVAVAFGSAVTVCLASRIGAPVSTTHALLGAIIGAGVAGAGIQQVNLSALWMRAFLPLTVSPLLSLLLTVVLFPSVAFVAGRVRDCFCVGQMELKALPVAGGSGSEAPTFRMMSVVLDRHERCEGLKAPVTVYLVDGLHWLSAGFMSFTRGINDTPKIVALLLGGSLVGLTADFFVIASAMAIGGVMGAARVARTMSEKITPMDPFQGLTANLITSLLVGVASLLGLPVSTTHVSCGSLFGIGLLRRGEADWRMAGQILLSWIVTLPLAAIAAGLFYLIVGRFS